MILDLALIRVFGRSRYISCNPEALQRDMEALSRTHETVRFAFFDHTVEGSNNAVHLRCPSVCDEHNFHQNSPEKTGDQKQEISCSKSGRQKQGSVSHEAAPSANI